MASDGHNAGQNAWLMMVKDGSNMVSTMFQHHDGSIMANAA